MISKYFTNVAVAVALASPALAADLPSRAAPAPILAPVPVSNWAGVYVGAHVGALFSEQDTRLGFLAVNCSVCGANETRTAGFDGYGKSSTGLMGGLQAGLNWQTGSFVYGLEADFSLAGIDERRRIAIPAATLAGAGLAAITDPVDGFSGDFSSTIDWLATARGRLGVSFGTFMIYGTGGAAFAHTETEARYVGLAGSPLAAVPVSAKDSDVQVGWTIGAGIEAMLMPNLSVKAEYLYADFGSTTRQFGYYINNPVAVRQSTFADEELSVQIVRVGLNYRFGL